MNTDVLQLAAIAKERADDASIKSEAYRLRLSEMQFYNWFTVVLPALLSLFAGTNVFAELQLLGIDWKILSGGAAFASAVLLAVHRGRRCDEYQANCQVLIQAFASLGSRYKSLADLKPADILDRVEDLDREKAELLKNIKATLPQRTLKKARSTLGLSTS